MSDLQRTVGRRAWDKGKTVSLIVLAVGVLFQGGFYLIVRDMLAANERQQNAERKERARQHDDQMLFLETTSEQLGAILNVERVQAGEKARPDPLTFRARRQKKAKELEQATKEAVKVGDQGGVKIP